MFTKLTPQCQVLTDEKLDNIRDRLEHPPCESLNSLANETRVSKGTKRTTTKLLKLWPYKTTVVNVLRSCDPAARLHFHNRYLQLAQKSEPDQSQHFPHKKFSFELEI
jgi:hypothetical protein